MDYHKRRPIHQQTDHIKLNFNKTTGQGKTLQLQLQTAQSRGEQSKESHETVSYKHLTLPTILLV